MGVWAGALQQQRESDAAYVDQYGVTVPVTNTEATPPTNTIAVKLT